VTVVLSELALSNSNTLLMLWWLLKGCMGQFFSDAVVWIAELNAGEKSWKLVEISLTTLS